MINLGATLLDLRLHGIKRDFFVELFLFQANLAGLDCLELEDRIMQLQFDLMRCTIVP